MIQSMTGYGRTQIEFERQTVTIEIKSVNSKTLDMRLRMPVNYQHKEIAIRKSLTQSIIRGKVDLNLSVESNEDISHSVDMASFNHFYQQLAEISGTQGIPQGDILYTVTRMPGVVVQNDEKADETKWAEVRQALDTAVLQFQNYRKEEGAALEKDIRQRIVNIKERLVQIPQYESERIEKTKSRLLQNLEQIRMSTKVDENRLEQEMVFYLDKFDLTEEKIRLEQHCEYFIKELDNNHYKSIGKKLTFILQEMGREINTIGSKANHATIQHLVVQMKNEADKIKEQLANIL